MKLKHKRWRDYAFENIRLNGAMTVHSLLETTVSPYTGKAVIYSPSILAATELLKIDCRFIGCSVRRFGLHGIVMWDIER